MTKPRLLEFELENRRKDRRTSSHVVLDWSSVLMSSRLSSRLPVADESSRRMSSSSFAWVRFPVATCEIGPIG